MSTTPIRSLPGISPRAAAAMEKNRRLKTVEGALAFVETRGEKALLAVPGVGPHALLRLRDYRDAQAEKQIYRKEE